MQKSFSKQKEVFLYLDKRSTQLPQHHGSSLVQQKALKVCPKVVNILIVLGMPTSSLLGHYDKVRMLESYSKHDKP